jgi:23S rRNA (adenine-N6)-dimethyltransferase
MLPARSRPLSLSQNFLTSRALVDRLLAASSIRTGDLVFDLGAGSGLIAERLAHRGCDVIAVEKDPGLAHLLTVWFADEPLVRVCHADVGEMVLPRRPYKVFANIPFDTTAAIVDRLTHAPCAPEDSYLVMQREAAMRFVGQPRGTLIATLLRPWFEPAIVHRFRRTDFVPAPHVEVVMLRLHKRGPPLVQLADAQVYRDFVVSMFTAHQSSVLGSLRRLVGSLRARRVATHAGLDPLATPSQVAFDCWLEVFNTLKRASALHTQGMLSGAEGRLMRQQRRLRKVHRTSAGGRARQSRTAAPRTEMTLRPRLTCRPPPGAMLIRSFPINESAVIHGHYACAGCGCDTGRAPVINIEPVVCEVGGWRNLVPLSGPVPICLADAGAP